MADIIQESYNLVNHFFGETNPKGQKRVPDKHEPLIRAIESLVQHAYRCGLVDGKFELQSEVEKFAKVACGNRPAYPKYNPDFKKE